MALSLRYAFGRGQAIFDVGFGGDDRVFSVVADPLGYHLVGVPKQPGSVWAMDSLPDPAQTCRMRAECHLSQHSKQVLAFTVPPHNENNQTNVSIKTYPDGIPVLAQGSSTEKAYFIVGEQAYHPVVSAEYSFNYMRRVLTVKTPQPGQRMPIIHIHDTLSKICLSNDPAVFNWHDNVFQNFLHTSGLRRQPHEDEIMFARRAQQWLAINMAYTPVSQLSKAGGAASLCTQRETDAAGHAVLYVSILRANNVAARVLIGRWVSSDIQPADHVRAEFFADNVGWVPVETIEKGESLYFGSDPKAPFVITSFGEMTSSFRIASSTTHAFKDRLPVTVTLSWREPHFMFIAGNVPGIGSNLESWSSAIGDANSSMPNLPGSAHQTPTNQRFSKAHEGGAPSVGARSRPYAGSVPTSTAPGYMPHHTTNNAPAQYSAPPPVPNRAHAHNSVQYTTFNQQPSNGYNNNVMQSQQPPALPPHGGSQLSPHTPQLSPHGPPSLPPQNNGYGGPPQLPPSNQGYHGGPPQLPPSNQGYNQQNNGYGQNNGYNQGPPQLPPSNQNNGYNQGPQQGHTGTLPAPGPYQPQGNISPRYGNQGPPPNLPPQQQQQGPPQQQQYQQYGNQQHAPPSNAAPMQIPSVAQPRPISNAPQHHLANMETAHANANLESAQAGGTAHEQVNPVSAAPKKGAVKVAVLPPGPASSPGGTPVKPSAAKAAGFPAKQGGAAKVPGLAVNNIGGAPKKTGFSTSPRRRTFARAMFDHSPQDHLELPLQKGDIVEIFSEDDSGWWKAERLGKSGIVPAPYVEKLPPGTRIAKAAFPFESQEASDLHLALGELAIVHRSDDGGWWQAEAHGNQGNVPANYVQVQE